MKADIYNIPTAIGFTSYVWHKGKVYYRPELPCYGGMVSLVSLKDSSLGVAALPEDIRNCTSAEMEAAESLRVKP